MTEATQGRQVRSEEVQGVSSKYTPSTVDPASDNDASEKSAREKFKKTSLASLSQNAFPSEAALEEKTERVDSNATELAGPSMLEENATEEPRGRAVAKRALEDEDTDLPARENPAGYERLPESSNGHLRKRSRDVRVGHLVKDDGRLYDRQEESLREVIQETAQEDRIGMTSQERTENSLMSDADDSDAANIPVHSKSEEISRLPNAVDKRSVEAANSTKVFEKDEKAMSEDEEMRDGAYSPRKKRSRDQMDSEADREQKIAATEETKAQRRSDELDRADVSLHKGPGGLPNGPNSTVMATSIPNLTPGSSIGTNTSDLPKATFGATNKLQPSPGPSISKSPLIASQDASDGTQDRQATAPSGFASSGFASFASSTASPFGAAGTSLNAAPPSSLANSAPSTIEKPESQLPTSEGIGGFGSFAKKPLSGFSTDQKSPFATAASNTGSAFGGSVFGSSFGHGFGSGGKLTSFAAPTGDAKLGSANGSFKPIGSSSHEHEEKEGSESDGDGEEDQNKEDEVGETDDRFQHQDVETGEDGEDTIFSSRAKLYAFKDNNWKEAGNGIFKLNVISSDGNEDTQKTGRFIMRAHQTYRVLLNQPIFPQMKVGDRLGNEPTAKAFAFAGIEDGKPIPHMVRLGDVSESKTLYHRVLQLQHDLKGEAQGQTLVPREETEKVLRVKKARPQINRSEPRQVIHVTDNKQSSTQDNWDASGVTRSNI